MIFFGWAYWTWWQLNSWGFTIFGWVLLLPLAASGAWVTRPSKAKMFADRQVTAWLGGWLTLIWGNEEDGVVPPALVNGVPYMPGKPDWLRAYIWTAWRNSANNMRFLPGASFLISRATLRFEDRPHGYVATDGWRQCVEWRGFHWGWLIKRGAQDGWRAWPVISKV